MKIQALKNKTFYTYHLKINYDGLVAQLGGLFFSEKKSTRGKENAFRLKIRRRSEQLERYADNVEILSFDESRKGREFKSPRVHQQIPFFFKRKVFVFPKENDIQQKVTKPG